MQKEIICFVVLIIVCWTVGIVATILRWKKDCKEIGKERLAVPLSDRLIGFALLFIVPLIVGLLI